MHSSIIFVNLDVVMRKFLLPILFITSLFGAKYLAVLDLEPESISASEAKILTQRLTSQIIALSDYTVVERANIDKILKEQKFQHSGCTDRECAVEIGQLLNADVTVVGTVSKLGETYTIDSRIIDVRNGEALGSASYTHTGNIDQLVKYGIESIAYELLGNKRPLLKIMSSMFYDNRYIVGAVAFLFWIGWGLLPA